MTSMSHRGVAAVRADASDPVKIVSDLNSAFTAFKAANDQRLSQLEKGREDVVTRDKVERIDASISDLQKALDESNQRFASLQLSGNTAKPADPEYVQAFSAHVRRGDVQASLNKGAASEGGYLAPVEWDRTIMDRMVEVSPMRQIATVIQVTGTGFKKLVPTQGFASGWVGETAARPETTGPAFAEAQFGWGEIYANPAATQQLLDDSAIDLEAWMANEVETEFAYQEGVAFVSGDGSNKPRGVLSYRAGGASASAHPLGAVAEVISGAAADITADGLISLVYALPERYRAGARFAMNNGTMAAVRKLKDGQGNYLWQPSAIAGQPSTLLGYGLTEMPAMPDVAAGAYPVAFGDFRRGYTIFDRVGIRILRDPYSNKPYVMFYTTKRVGGGVTDPRALRFQKISAT